MEESLRPLVPSGILAVLLEDVAHVLLALAFLAIPWLLYVFARRRPEARLRSALALFGAALALAGLALLAGAFVPARLRPLAWGLEGLAALVAWALVFVLLRALPRALALRSPEELQAETERRRGVEASLREASLLLERRVERRTAELAASNARLTAEAAAREEVQRRLLAKDTVTRTLAASETLAEAGPRVLRAVGEAIDASAGAIWAREAASALLRPIATWRAEALDAVDFEEETRRRSFGAGEGLPGRVWAERTPVLSKDFAAEEAALRAPSAAAAGLRSAFGFPIVSDLVVEGAIEFFFPELPGADRPLLDLADSVGSQLGQFVSRRRAQAELRRRNEELRILTDSLPALVSYVDAEERYRFHNQAYERWFGPQVRDQVGKTLREALGEATYAAIEPHVRRALAGERVTYEVRLPHRAGSRWVHAEYVPDVSPDGAVRGYFSLVTDVSEAKAAEERLRESEERFRTMADTAPVFIGMTAPDGRIEFLNRAWREFHGGDAFDWQSPLHPDERVDVGERVARGLEARRPFSFEARFRRADGEYRWILVQVQPRLGAGGRLEGYVSSGFDLTERRRAEQALRDGEERFRSMVEGVRDHAIHSLDPQGRVTSWNAGAERLHGYPTDAILGEHVSVFFPPDLVEAGRVGSLLGEAEREGSARDQGWRLRRDGSRFWAEAVLTAFRDADGVLRGFSRVVHDATERRAAEEALRESEGRMRSIVDTALDAVVAMDDEGRVREWNAQAERMFGWTRAEAVGQRLSDLIIPDRYRDAHVRGLARFLATGEGPVLNRRIEIEAVRRDGTEIPVELAISPVRLAGHYVFSSFLRDLSDRRVLEALRRRSDDLEMEKRRIEEGSRLKSEFLANMSHELRTPMNAVIGFAELVHDGKAGPLNADQREYLGDILTSARHLLQLIDDVLDLSKVEAGRIDLRPERVPLARLVEEVRDILRGLAGKKRIQVALETEAGPEEVHADPRRLKQILYNYLSNALKFTPEHGHVAVRTRPEGEGAFRLEVQDDGPGIAPEDQARLFVEFQQLDEGAAKRFQGTGLGLALTRRLAEAMGGTVGLESARGAGSTFFAVLPRESPAGDGASAPLRDVLVVSESAGARERLADLLAAAGYGAETAASGPEAVARCRERAFAAIAIGPVAGASGADALRAIRETDRNRTTPAVVVAESATDAALTGLRVEDWLSGPLGEGGLSAALERVPAPAARARRVVVVAEEREAARSAAGMLERGGWDVSTSVGAEGVAGAIATARPAAVVLCARPGDDRAFPLLEAVRARANGGIPVILWDSLGSRSGAGADGPTRARRPGAPGPVHGLLRTVADCVARRADGERRNGRGA